MKIKIIRYETLGSTNTEAIAHALKGAAEGLCIVAERQRQGRGREGRQWHSEKGGLYFSIVLRPKIEKRFLPVLTLMSAVAVHDTLAEACGLELDIKWPNDVLIGGKKISGILLETCETDQGLAVIIGIGINYSTDAFPEELRELATSIRDETGKEPDREQILETLTQNLTSNYQSFNSDSDPQPIFDAWAARSSYNDGKEITVKTRNSSLSGVTMGLDQFGSLLVQTPNEGVVAITAGDVEAVRPKEVIH